MNNTNSLFTYSYIAGLIDGDGFIRVYKNTGEYVVTMHLEDQPLLSQLIEQFGGYTQKVLNKNSIRWHLNAKTALNGKKTLVDLTRGLNGLIRNTIRLTQFKKVCQAFNLEPIEPKLLTGQDGYIAGLFITDGSIYINCRPSAADKKEKASNSDTFKRELAEFQLLSPTEQKAHRILKGVAPVIEIRIVNKHLVNVGDISKAINMGTTYFSRGDIRAPDGHFAFFIKKEKEIMPFIDYMNKYRTASVKHKRLDLVTEFYSLKNKRAHLPDADPILNVEWQALIREWYSSSYTH